LVAEGFPPKADLPTADSLRGRAEKMEETPSAIRLDKNNLEAYAKR